jgi:hypothetical protein
MQEREGRALVPGLWNGCCSSYRSAGAGILSIPDRLQSASADSNRVELSEYLGDLSRFLENSVRELRPVTIEQPHNGRREASARNAGVIFLPGKCQNQLHGGFGTETYEQLVGSMKTWQSGDKY